jgi:hypothetical protein
MNWKEVRLHLTFLRILAIQLTRYSPREVRTVRTVQVCEQRLELLEIKQAANAVADFQTLKRS